jgi:hypothetical protein
MNRVDDASAGTPERTEDSPISGAAYERVGGTVTCVLTRFQAPSVWSLPFFYLAFRQIHKQALAKAPGLIKALFLIENLRTYWVLSLWIDDKAIVEFGTRVSSHVSHANWALLHVFRKDLQRPELWSVQWRLWAVSHNLNWEGVDLRRSLLGYRRRPVTRSGGGRLTRQRHDRECAMGDSAFSRLYVCSVCREQA